MRIVLEIAARIAMKIRILIRLVFGFEIEFGVEILYASVRMTFVAVGFDVLSNPWGSDLTLAES